MFHCRYLLRTDDDLGRTVRSVQLVEKIGCPKSDKDFGA